MHICCPQCHGNPLRVEIHTGTHLILGAVPSPSRRLAELCDILARPRPPVQDARIQPLQGAGGERYRREERLLIDRNDIRLCIPYGCRADWEDEAEGERRKYATPVSLHLSSMEIEGQVLVEQGQSAGDVLQGEGSPFFVLVDARIRYLDEALSLPFTAETVLVNQIHVRLAAPQREAARPMSRLAELLKQSDVAPRF